MSLQIVQPDSLVGNVGGAHMDAIRAGLIVNAAHAGINIDNELGVWVRYHYVSDDVRENVINPAIQAKNCATIPQLTAEVDGERVECNIPIGLTIITGKAGSGKTRFLQRDVIPTLDQNGFHVRVLNIGEPGVLIPYKHTLISRALSSLIDDANVTEHKVLVIDSLMGLWYDPAVVRDMPIGKGGASFGVPSFLQVLGDVALVNGVRIVAVLHPVFSDPDVIESGISGVSSLFINLDTNAFILRDYTEMQADANKIDYTRIAGGDINGDQSVRFLLETIGDED